MPRWKNAFQTNDEIFRLKRAAVLREANRIMGRSGFHNTSLDDIAASLQVSKGTLYNYVTDKQEILFECHMVALDIGQDAYLFAEANGATGFEKFRLLLRAYIVWMNGVIGGGVMSDVSALRPDDRQTIIARRDESDAQLVGFIEEGIRDGSIRTVNPKMVLFTTMGAVNSIPTWYLPTGPLKPEQIADEMIDIIARGLATTPKISENIPIPSYASVGGQGFESEAPRDAREETTEKSRRKASSPRKRTAKPRKADANADKASTGKTAKTGPETTKQKPSTKTKKPAKRAAGRQTLKIIG